jgi:hypothetical protein
LAIGTPNVGQLLKRRQRFGPGRVPFLGWDGIFCGVTAAPFPKFNLSLSYGSWWNFYFVIGAGYEESKVKIPHALFGLAALGGAALSAATASAMPIGLATNVDIAANVEQVRLVCDAYGRCFRTRGYGYGGPRYYGGYGYGGGYRRGWHHGRRW